MRPTIRAARAAATAALALVSAGALVGAAAGSGAAPPGPRPIDPALFQAGSCVAFLPTSAPKRLTVYIDVGHGGPDPGAVGTTAAGHSVHEAALTLSVALDALPLLRRAGLRVVLSRTGSAAVARPLAGDLSGGVFTAQGDHRDLVARDVCADRARADVLLGLYFDATASAAARGSLTLYDSDRPFWRASLRMAGLVEHDVVAALDALGAAVVDGGVHNDVGYGSAVTQADRAYGHLVLLGPPKAGYLPTPTEMPGALIEPLYVTNPADASLAASASGQHAIARGLAGAVEQYFRRGAASSRRDRRADR